MKRFIIAIFACAGACVVSAADYADLKLGTNQWFRASVTGNALSATGVSMVCGGESVIYGNGRMEVDGDIDSPVRFATAGDNSLTQDLATVVLNLEASVVPETALPDINSGAKVAKVAFAILKKADGTRHYNAWAGSWVPLTGTPPADGVEYTVVARFDNRDAAKKVQFAIVSGSTEEILVPSAGGSSWLTCNSAVCDDVLIDFVGSGKIKSFNADQLNVISEIIIAGDSKVEVPEADAGAMNAAAKSAGLSVGDFLAAAAKETIAGFKTAGVSVAEAYALGLVAKNGSGVMAAVNDGEIKIKASGSTSTASSIKLAFTGLSPRNDTGATVTCQLMGSADGSLWTEIGEEVGNLGAVAIPTESIGTYNYFKVVTKAVFPSR